MCDNDKDNDGVLDERDNCIYVPNPDQKHTVNYDMKCKRACSKNYSDLFWLFHIEMTSWLCLDQAPSLPRPPVNSVNVPTRKTFEAMKFEHLSFKGITY